MPHGFDTFEEGLRAGVETYHALKAELKKDGLLGGIGDEGGFAPNLPANEDGLKYMVRAIKERLFHGRNWDCTRRRLNGISEGRRLPHGRQGVSSDDLVEMYGGWLDRYPILSIEDGFGEDDWRGWATFTKPTATASKRWATTSSDPV